MHIKFLITLLFVFSSVTTVIAAEKNLDEAVEAMRAGDFAVAYCIMRPLADSGDADAQYNIGWMYLNGYGLRVNDSNALQWWQLASEQGHTDASFSIGMLYSLGEGKVSKDMNLAVDFYLLAAKEGQEDAISLLKSMMIRNDKAVLSRLDTIVSQTGDLLGHKRLVKANKLNVRAGPSIKEKIVTRVVKGQEVLELHKQGKWSQVVVQGNSEINRTVWVYSSLLESE